MLAFMLSVAAGWLVYTWGKLGYVYLATFGVLCVTMLYHYIRLFHAPADSLATAAKANHFGGFYFFIVSGSILPDYALRHLLR
jgi:hypothetical protein